MPKQIVINSQFGGFSLSRQAFLELRKRKNKHAKAEPDIGEKWDDGSIRPKNGLSDFFCRDIPRDDPDLIAVVRQLGEGANGQCANLTIIKIPDNVDWVVEEYDGSEWVAEKHKTWR